MFSKIPHKIKNHTSTWYDFLIDTIFPKECLGCSTEGTWLCEKCFGTIELIQTQSCPVCSKNNLAGSFCKDCRTGNSLDGVLVSANYKNKLLSKTIKTFKYKLIKDLSAPLSRLQIDLLKNILNNPEKNYFWHNSNNHIIKHFSEYIVIPVPLHSKRRRWRGFNQSEELAKMFTEYFNLELNLNNLRRIKFIRPQTKLTKKERFKNVKNSFTWSGEDLGDKNIILIDDVSTSTATLSECAQVLRKSGAKKIWGLVIAHG